MATSDVDGRMAQWMRDQMACLGMEINESIREAREKLDALLEEMDED